MMQNVEKDRKEWLNIKRADRLQARAICIAVEHPLKMKVERAHRLELCETAGLAS